MSTLLLIYCCSSITAGYASWTKNYHSAEWNSNKIIWTVSPNNTLTTAWKINCLLTNNPRTSNLFTVNAYAHMHRHIHFIILVLSVFEKSIPLSAPYLLFSLCILPEQDCLRITHFARGLSCDFVVNSSFINCVSIICKHTHVSASCFYTWVCLYFLGG